MKILISILIVLAVGIGGYKLYEHWNTVKEQGIQQRKAAAGATINPDTLSGMPYQLLPKLRESQQAGPETFKRFIDGCKNFPDVKDPRLAWMELDYMVMISSTDPVEAKKIFFDVKKRTPTESPIYPRIKALEKSYE
jgi:hypothetical protein